jgi:F0F1-type ATP synthase assembly protein I
MTFAFGLIIGLLVGYCAGAYSFYNYAVKRGWMGRDGNDCEEQ